MSLLEVTFRQEAQKCIDSENGLEHIWDQCEIGSTCCLRFPPKDLNGFEVEVHVDSNGIVVFGQGSHIHFDEDGDPNMKVKNALALVRDMLSKNMKIVEYWAGKSPYKWKLQLFDGTKWQTEDHMCLFVFNYFGRRSKKILQNTQLPPREMKTQRGQITNRQ